MRAIAVMVWCWLLLLWWWWLCVDEAHQWVQMCLGLHQWGVAVSLTLSVFLMGVVVVGWTAGLM